MVSSSVEKKLKTTPILNSKKVSKKTKSAKKVTKNTKLAVEKKPKELKKIKASGKKSAEEIVLVDSSLPPSGPASKHTFTTIIVMTTADLDS